MNAYKKIIASFSIFSSARMMIGGISAVYIIQHGASIVDLGYIKSFQAAVLLLFGFFAGSLADRLDRRFMYCFSVFFACLWLFIMFLAGYDRSVVLFYFAEAANSISLVIFQNTSNAYLIDQYQKDTRKNDFEQPLGRLNKYVFLGMAVFALTGSWLYMFFPLQIFFLSSLIMALIWVASYTLLPEQVVSRKRSGGSGSDRKVYPVILRKIMGNRYVLLLFFLVSTYYQLIIQYWQIIAHEIAVIQQHTVFLGVIFVLNSMIQSFAGYLLQHNKVNMKSLFFMISMMIVSLVMLFLSIYFNNAFVLILSLVTLFFALRLIMILVNVDVHKNISAVIRARFDACLNTVIRLLSIICFVVISLVSGYYDKTGYLLMITGVICCFFSFASLLRRRHHGKPALLARRI